jgi:hypothetical protein
VVKLKPLVKEGIDINNDEEEMGEQHTRESIARTLLPTPSLFNNLHKYFQPIFDQLDELNKVVDYLLGEEKNDRARERKRSDWRSWEYYKVWICLLHGAAVEGKHKTIQSFATCAMITIVQKTATHLLKHARPWLKF